MPVADVFSMEDKCMLVALKKQLSLLNPVSTEMEAVFCF